MPSAVRQQGKGATADIRVSPPAHARSTAMPGRLRACMHASAPGPRQGASAGRCAPCATALADIMLPAAAAAVLLSTSVATCGQHHVWPAARLQNLASICWSKQHEEPHRGCEHGLRLLAVATTSCVAITSPLGQRGHQSRQGLPPEGARVGAPQGWMAPHHAPY